MVMRYYTCKEDLFATAAQIDCRIPDLAALPVARRGVALLPISSIVGKILRPAGELQALLRAAGTHALAQRRLVELVEKQAIPVIQSVMSRDHSQERLGLIILQLAGLVMSRYFLKHAFVLALDRDVIIRQVGAIVQALPHRTASSAPKALSPLAWLRELRLLCRSLLTRTLQKPPPRHLTAQVRIMYFAV